MDSKQEKKLLKKKKKNSQKANTLQNKIEESVVTKKNTSLRLDSNVLKALKIKAIEQDSSIQKIVETLIHDYLESND